MVLIQKRFISKCFIRKQIGFRQIDVIPGSKLIIIKKYTVNPKIIHSIISGIIIFYFSVIKF